MNEKERLEKILLAKNVRDSLHENEEIVFNIIPELRFERDFEQKSEWHQYDVWNHTIEAIVNSPMDFEIRLVLLLHDIGKPFSYQDDGNTRHFKNHAKKSSEMALNILKRININQNLVDEIIFLIENHSNKVMVDEINLDNIDLYNKLILIKTCDGLAYEKEHSKLIIEDLNKTKEIINKKYFL